ncbi:ERF family protein, partial [Escherichia coli]|nr:ERF family protein [Escherichia coli]
LIGNRYYVKATATLSDGEDVIAVTAYAREEESKKGMDASQLTGATSSYARKYALNGLFCIDDAKDPDTDAYAKQTNQQPRQQ